MVYLVLKCACSNGLQNCPDMFKSLAEYILMGCDLIGLYQTCTGGIWPYCSPNSVWCLP